MSRRRGLKVSIFLCHPCTQNRHFFYFPHNRPINFLGNNKLRKTPLFSVNPKQDSKAGLLANHCSEGETFLVCYIGGCFCFSGHLAVLPILPEQEGLLMGSELCFLYNDQNLSSLVVYTINILSFWKSLPHKA